MNTTKTKKEARLEARVSSATDEFVRRAAELRGMTLTSFIVNAVMKEAEAVVQNDAVLKLSKHDQEVFVAALEHPPKMSPALERAKELHSQRIKSL